MYGTSEAWVLLRGSASAATNYSLNIVLQLINYLHELLKAQGTNCQTVSERQGHHSPAELQMRH